MRTQLIAAAALSVALAVASSASAQATPSEDYETAKNSFRTGDFNRVISLISGLLYPESQFKSENERRDAHLLLGVSYFQAGNRAAARKQFAEALDLDFRLNNELTLSVSPPLFSTEASDFFNQEKEDYLKEYETEKELFEKAEEAARLKFILDNMLVSERRLFYANFIPLGVGQFQNGHRGKGIFFLTTQIATIGLSTGLFTYQLLAYPNAKVPRDEVDTAKAIQIVQVTSGALAIGLVIGGILDAWYHYEPTVLRKPDAELLEQWEKLRDDLPNRKKKKTGALDSLKLVPTVTEEGFGAAVFLEF